MHGNEHMVLAFAFSSSFETDLRAPQSNRHAESGEDADGCGVCCSLRLNDLTPRNRSEVDMWQIQGQVSYPSALSDRASAPDHPSTCQNSRTMLGMHFHQSGLAKSQRSLPNSNCVLVLTSQALSAEVHKAALASAPSEQANRSLRRSRPLPGPAIPAAAAPASSAKCGAGVF